MAHTIVAIVDTVVCCGVLEYLSKINETQVSPLLPFVYFEEFCMFVIHNDSHLIRFGQIKQHFPYLSVVE